MIKIQLDKLKKAKWNYKTENEGLTGKLIANIKRNKQIENLIVREKGKSFEVVNGNHRLTAMQQLKLKNAWCYNLGKIKDSEAKRIAIETNETKFESDNIKMAEIINDILKDFDISELEKTMPYSEEELKNFNELLEFDWDTFNTDGATAEPDGKVKFEIIVDENDAIISDELEKVCNKYGSAKLTRK